MAQCQSPEELLNLISRIVDAMINQYLLCGTLQGGLNACNEDSILPENTQIVLCRQLAQLVQQGLDDGSIVAPTVVEIRYEGSTLILHKADGTNLSLDLKPLIDGVISEAFIDCSGAQIPVGTALATCMDLDTAKLALETQIKLFETELEGIVNTIDQKINAKTAEWANTILRELITLLEETRVVYHDDSLVGDGHEPAPLQVNPLWLREQVDNLLTELLVYKDCCGGDITRESVLVTCECLQEQLEKLVDEIKAWAEDQDAKVLEAANNYTDTAIQEALENIDPDTIICQLKKTLTPLDAHIISQRSAEIKGLSIVGYGFSLGNSEAILQGATIALSPSLCKEGSSTSAEAYIWAAEDAARHIVIPIYDCSGAIIGYASAIPFIINADCE